MKIAAWLRNHITLHTHDTPREELANALTHLVGAIGALAGTIALVTRSVLGTQL